MTNPNHQPEPTMKSRTVHHESAKRWTLAVIPGLATVHAPKDSPDHINNPIQFDEATAAKMLATFGRLRAALVRLNEETNPFITDPDGCECGEHGTGFNDAGEPCEHIQAARALAETADIITH